MEAKNINHSERAHALLSASGAERWLNCTPSARLSEDFPDETSVFAAEGTLAHEFADIGLKLASGQLTKRKHSLALKALREDDLYTDEMEDEVQKYIDYVSEEFIDAKRRSKDAQLIIEERVDMTDYIDEGFGTNDAVILADGVLEVVDLKYGKGVKVSADDNPQLKLYALGSLAYKEMLFDIHTVKLTIVQPRLDSISSYTLSVEDLKEWGENIVKPRAKLAFAGEGEFAVGDWCKWCKAKAICVAMAEANLKEAQLEFADLEDTDEIDLPVVVTMTDEQLLNIYEKASRISDWLSAIETHIKQTAMEGKVWEGYKLVEGRSVRKYSDEAKVLEALLDAGYDSKEVEVTKVKTLSQIEKLLGKVKFTEVLADLVIKPQGAPTLAPITDKRPALGMDSAEADFT